MVYIVWAEALIIILFTVLLMKDLLKKKAADAPTAADPPAGSVPLSKQPYVKRSLRVDVPHIESKIIIIDIDTKRFKALNQKYFTGYIENISLTGLKFSSAYNIPIQENITISLHFSLDDEDFTLQARWPGSTRSYQAPTSSTGWSSSKSAKRTGNAWRASFISCRL